MLAILVFLPIIAFIAILLGAPARLTAIGASAVNLALGSTPPSRGTKPSGRFPCRSSRNPRSTSPSVFPMA
jgi:hypothetical protein